ncbi:hypothetical protein NDU88_003920 [Pleurodeles waltl]|uniref:Uncharacterized protein n=1 Tax=Pleurodeles waltl TaxID=8319 RepID=A0AAV7WUE4_PLEWA|nr:hypothetical protein NDU88_003920 [Pleurodeles waltl]
MQENSSEHIDSLPADNQSALKENYMLISGDRAHSEGAMEISHENDSLLAMLQGADGGPMDALGNREDQKASNREEVNVAVSKSMQLQPVEFNGSVQDIQDEVDILPVVCAGAQDTRSKILSGGSELLAQSSKTLKWDYLGTKLTGTAKVPIPDVQLNADRGADGRVGCPVLSIGTTSTDSEMLQSIYDSIEELQTETKVESRRAQIATKRLQGTVHKVVKSCIEIEEKLNTMEERMMAVEADVEALREQCLAHGGQLTDIMWKLEDQENRQRRNNLRFLGIGEGVEGNDTRAYMIKTL